VRLFSSFFFFTHIYLYVHTYIMYESCSCASVFLKCFFFYEEKGMCSCVHMNKYIQESRTVYATSLRVHIFFPFCVGVCVCAYVYVFERGTYICRYVGICMYIYRHIQTYSYIYTYIQTYSYIYTYTYVSWYGRGRGHNAQYFRIFIYIYLYIDR
jgi:hypothetical protein